MRPVCLKRAPSSLNNFGNSEVLVDRVMSKLFMQGGCQFDASAVIFFRSQINTLRILLDITP